MRTSTACRSVTTATPTPASSRNCPRSASTASISAAGITPDRAAGAVDVPLGAEGHGRRSADGTSAGVTRHPSRQPGAARRARHSLAGGAVGRCAEGHLRPGLRRVARPDAETFEQVQEGRELKLATIRHIVELLVQKVAGSSAALAQILAVKLYENLTYCHSVNVATLSLLIAKQVGFDEATTAAIGEAALLHDIGKTRIPLEVIRKPGALDKRERALMESHTTFGAEILVEVDGLRPLTPTVALEHHREREGERLSRARRPGAAFHEPARFRRRHLRSDHRRPDVSGPRTARAGVPRARTARRRKAQFRAGQGVRCRGDVLPGGFRRAHEPRRNRRGRRDQRGRAAASRHCARRRRTSAVCLATSIRRPAIRSAAMPGTSSRRSAHRSRWI